MQSNNPVFNRSEAFKTGAAGYGAVSSSQLQDLYDAPARTPGHERPMTFDSVMIRTAATFAVLLATAAVSWRLTPSVGSILPLGAMFLGLGLGLYLSFKQSTSPALILAYSAVQGVFVGGISVVLNNAYPGVVSQAIIGTLGAFASMLFLYKTGLIKVNDRFRRTMMVALGGYAVIALVSLVSAFLGVGDGWGFYGVGLFGIVLCLAGVTLAAFTLMLDFDFIDRGVRAGMPERYSWLAAFGLTVTLVWLYIEILRLLSILRGD